MPMRTLDRRGASGRAGFTLLEVVISAAIFGLIMASMQVMTATGRSAFDATSKQAELDARVKTAADRVAMELVSAARNRIFPDLTGVVTDTSTLALQQVVDIQAGAPVFGNLLMLTFDNAVGEVADGLDNNGNGLVDEGRLVMTRDLGGPNQISVTLCTNLSRYLEGELAGGGDENGNGLTDELGFNIQRVGDVLTVRLSIEERSGAGENVIRTTETSVRLRN